jgi:hypothetical protein
MDSEVLEVILAIVAFFGLAIAGVRGVPFVGLAMAAIGVFLGLEALRALDYAKPMHEFHCDESCYDGPGQPWWRSLDAWQWSALWIAAVAGTVAVWLSVPTAALAGVARLWPRVHRAGGRVYVPAIAAMTLAVVSYGAFTLIVAPLGDRYGI